MQVPLSVKQLLESQNVNYNVTELASRKNLTLVASGKSNCLVKSLLVQDSKGRVQVLVPADNILDLDALFRQFGRRFVGVPNSEIRPLIDKMQLTSVPAIPRWQGMPTLVDSSLLKRNRLMLESGNKGQVLELTQKDFANIIRSATTGNFTVPAPELSSDPNGDEKAILNSVQKFTELRVKQRLSETLELPPLPESAQRIIKLRADPNADINDLTDVVEIDPSLAAQVVSWAASPYYSAPGKIRSVHDAIVRVLGFDMVLNLALGLALGKSLSMSAIKPSQIDQYWRSSVYTAAVIEGLVGKIPRDSRPTFGMAYLSGLLNNFGYLILAEVFPPYFESVSRLTSGNPHIPNAAIEQHLIGITGNQIASWLLDNWNMPEEVVTALRQQNNLQYDGEYKEYAKLIHLAKGLLANAGIGDSYGRNIDDVEIEALNLTRGAVTEVIENIVEASDDLDSIAEKMRG